MAAIPAAAQAAARIERAEPRRELIVGHPQRIDAHPSRVDKLGVAEVVVISSADVGGELAAKMHAREIELTHANSYHFMKDSAEAFER